jgi:hypothetical protein
MASDWYYQRNGKPSEALSLTKLKQLIAAGKLPKSVLVWNDEMTLWQAADTLPEFMPPPPVVAKVVEAVEISPERSPPATPPPRPVRTEAAPTIDEFLGVDNPLPPIPATSGPASRSVKHKARGQGQRQQGTATY